MMVWGGISLNGKTQLVTVNGTLNAQKYRDDILAPVVLPFVQAGNGVTILQQDNARPHTARATTQFLAANNVHVMEWPSMSPDLSLIACSPLSAYKPSTASGDVASRVEQSPNQHRSSVYPIHEKSLPCSDKL